MRKIQGSCKMNDKSDDDGGESHHSTLNAIQSNDLVDMPNSITFDRIQKHTPQYSELESPLNGNNHNTMENDDNLIHFHTESVQHYQPPSLTDIADDTRHTLKVQDGNSSTTIAAEIFLDNNELTVLNDCNETMPSLDLLNASSSVSSVKLNVVEAINQQLLNEIDRSHTGNVNSSKDHDLMLTMNNSNNGGRIVNTASAVDCMNAGIKTMKMNNSDILNNEHRDFKRLGTYCTLRPQQRRKHLLKVLPALRHTNLLRSILAQRNGKQSTTTVTAMPADNERSMYNDLDTFLNNLDEIMMSKRGHTKNASADSNTLLPANRVGRSFYQDHSAIGTHLLFGAENVENCLLELDHYLEEIDREYARTCTYGGDGVSGGSNNLIRPLNDDDQNNTFINNNLIDNTIDNENNVNSLETIDLGNAVVTETSNVQLNNIHCDKDYIGVASNSIDSDIQSDPIAVNNANDDNNDDMLDNSVFSKVSKRMSCSDWDLDSVGGTIGTTDTLQHKNELLKRRSRARCTISAFKDISAFGRGAERDRKNGKWHSKYCV